jgi:hypothetical protein
MIKLTELVHHYSSLRSTPLPFAIDMTAGRGQDTKYLASTHHQVLSLDIQPLAIQSTKELLQIHHINNVTLLLADHSTFDYSKYPQIDTVIYNLGYLPGGDKTIRTSAHCTILSLQLVLPRCKIGSNIFITLYPKENNDEANEVLRFCQRLDGRLYDVIKISVVNKELAPYILQITKILA